MGDRTAGSDRFHADEDQVRQIREYALRHGADVEVLPAELDVSGGLPLAQRPSLLAAVEGVEAGRYQGIVVAYLSRLTRSRSGIEIWDRVEAAGGHVHCAGEGIDTSTPSGRFIRDIHLANAVREREEHVDRFAERRRLSTEAGVWQSPFIPRGYIKGDDRRLHPGPDAAEIRSVFEDAAAGERVSRLADRLKMTTSGARALLANRVYLGELHVGQEINLHAHEPLVTEQVWRAAQPSSRARSPRRVDAGPALLAGVARCAGCGHLLTRRPAETKRKAPETYVCNVRHSGSKCPAPVSIGQQRLDDHVIALTVAEMERVRPRGTERTDRVDALRDELVKAEAELAAYLESVSAADVGVDRFREGARQRAERAAMARRELDQVETAGDLPAYADAAELFESFDAHGRNQLLRALLEVVVVKRAGGRGSRMPLNDRVRVVRQGAGLLDGLIPERGQAYGVVQIPWPDLGSPHVLGVPES